MWRFQIYGHLAKARGHRDGHFAGRLLREARSVKVLEGSGQGSGKCCERVGNACLGDSIFCLWLEQRATKGIRGEVERYSWERHRARATGPLHRLCLALLGKNL